MLITHELHKCKINKIHKENKAKFERAKFCVFERYAPMANMYYKTNGKPTKTLIRHHC